jgi:pectin methylesterase-like acyl-CoA thioesterase
MKTGLAALTVSLLFCLLLTVADCGVVHAEPLTTVVPDDFSTIQGAANNANPGDVVFVRTGVYFERVVLNKTISLIGESSKTTIVDGDKAARAWSRVNLSSSKSKL